MGNTRVQEIISTPSLETKREYHQAIADLFAKFDVLLAKLDADGGVTDVNYATLCTPTKKVVP